MKNSLPRVITLSGVKHIRLIWVCAWCSKTSYPKLHPQEEYTHGICEEHLRIQLSLYLAKKRE